MAFSAETRARAAFSAWLVGDDDGYRRQITALEDSGDESAELGLGFFLSAACGRAGEREPSATDSPEWIARGLLIACENAAERRTSAACAARAVAAADAGGLPFLQILTRVALAEFTRRPGAQLFLEAVSFAERLGSAPLLHALKSVPNDITLRRFLQILRETAMEDEA